VCLLLSVVSLSTPPSCGSSGIRLALPRVYNGMAAGCQGFLLQLGLYLATVHPAPSGRESVNALISCLTGRALEWANTVCRREGPTLDNYEDFTHRFLIDHYRCGLRQDVHRKLACRDTNLTFDQLVDVSIRLDNLLASRGRPDRGPSVPSPSTSDPTPIELGGAAMRGTGGGVISLHHLWPQRAHSWSVLGRFSRESRQGTGGSSQVSWHSTHPELPVSHLCV
jgi:hypothetical protein